MKKILIYPCGSQCAIEIFESLKNIKDLYLIGANTDFYNYGRFVFNEFYTLKNQTNNKEFLNEISGLIKTCGIEKIIPANDDACLFFSKHFPDITIGSSYETNWICRSKKRTYSALGGKILTPTIYNKKNIKFPAFLKPECGSGSKDTFIVHNVEELKFYVEKNKNLLMLQNLTGKEYTVDCFSINGQILYSKARERKRTYSGISSEAVFVNIPEINDIAVKINQTLVLDGAWFFQVKYHNSKPFLLEVAPRIAGASGINRSLDVNLPLLSLYHFLGYKVKIKSNVFSKVVMCKKLCNEYVIKDLKYDNVYIDFDDTLYIKKKINTSLMKFVFQCRNKNKNVVLISRHKGNLKNLLKELKIYDLFDKIIHLSENDSKDQFVENNSILIDDSFRERLSITRDIPTFDINSTGCLIDDEY